MMNVCINHTKIKNNIGSAEIYLRKLYIHCRKAVLFTVLY
jgi:hypothetical protein